MMIKVQIDIVIGEEEGGGGLKSMIFYGTNFHAWKNILLSHLGLRQQEYHITV